MAATPVYLEVGSKRVFTCSVDWPGWCRSGRTEELALETFASYGTRYAPVVARAGDAIRGCLVAVLGEPCDGSPIAGKRWPARYAARRIAWHVLDHAWEIQDRSK